MSVQRNRLAKRQSLSKQLYDSGYLWSYQAAGDVPMNSVKAYKADPLWGEMNIIGVDEQWDAVDNVTTSTAPTKQLINGQLYILRGDKTYTAQGQEVK